MRKIVTKKYAVTLLGMSLCLGCIIEPVRAVAIADNESLAPLTDIEQSIYGKLTYSFLNRMKISIS